MKKYYVIAFYKNIPFILMAIFFSAILVIAIISKNTTEPEPTIFVISFCSIMIVFVNFWIWFSSFYYRLQIDYEKKELLINYPYFRKKFKFDDIVSIEIKDYNKTSFDFVITTKTKKTNWAYPRYYKSRPTEKIIAIVNEVKQDLYNISNKNY